MEFPSWVRKAGLNLEIAPSGTPSEFQSSDVFKALTFPCCLLVKKETIFFVIGVKCDNWKHFSHRFEKSYSCSILYLYSADAALLLRCIVIDDYFKNISLLLYSKWFEPRSINSFYGVIVQVRVVLKRTVAGDWSCDNLSGSHLWSQVNSVCQSMML